MPDLDAGYLLKIRGDLAQVDWCLARLLRCKPLPPTMLVPHFWNDWPAELADDEPDSLHVKVMTGWVLNKVVPYICRLERKHLEGLADGPLDTDNF